MAINPAVASAAAPTSASAMRLAMLGVVAATIMAIVAIWVVIAPTHVQRRQLDHVTQQRIVVPPDVVPAVEPTAFIAVAPEKAREINDAIPFAKGPNPAARPFILTDLAAGRARAQDCLAAAMLYEAGSGDPEGQLAVAQVVINRLRHPAFPKTVCGVVFQGQERRTGCQFTFTCDGAMVRRPNEAGWAAAHARAGEMLEGRVFAPVGHSTHYHTDWVVPYWSSSLDKVVAVRTHLFFRWTGWWGTPGAFRGRHAGVEPAIGKLAAMGVAPAHMPATGETPLDAPALTVAAAGAQPVLDDGQGSFGLLIDPALPAGDFAALANATCADRPYCKVFAWTERAHLPAALPVPEDAYRLMAFSYLRDRARGFERALWNCDRHPRPDQRDCMKQRVLLPSAIADNFRLESLAARPRPAIIDQAPADRARAAAVPGPLAGVRRATPSSPTPLPSATPTEPQRLDAR